MTAHITTKKLSTKDWVIGNFLAGTMDLSVGALLGAIIMTMFDAAPTWQGLLLGSFATILPDLDIVLPILSRAMGGKALVGNHHEFPTHWPLCVVSIATITTYVLSGYSMMWTTIVFVGVVAHLVHDAVMLHGSDKWNWFIRLQPSFWVLEGRKDPANVEHEKWIRDNWTAPWSTLSATELLVAAAALAITFRLVFGVSM